MVRTDDLYLSKVLLQTESVIFYFGATYRVRTDDLYLGKVSLYQLS